MKLTYILALGCVVAALAGGCSDQNAVGPAEADNLSDGSGFRTFILSSAADPRLPVPMAESDRAIQDDYRMLAAADEEGPGRGKNKHYRQGEDPSVYWNNQTTQFGLDKRLPPPLMARAYALVHVAIYDAFIAGHVKKRQDLVDRAIAAGAASKVLIYLFPEKSEDIRSMAASQLYADHGKARGRLLRSWIIGRMVGELAVQHGMSDNSDLAFTDTIPVGDGIWTGTNPVLPMCGEWKTWIIASGSEIQPEPPYAFGSHEDSVDVQEVYDVSLNRTEEQIAVVHKWGDVSPPTIWCRYLIERVVGHKVGAFASARGFAYLTTTMYDAFVSCWKTKYTYWTARPFHRIPGLVTVIPTPNFPSYSSGHSTISGAASAVMGELFPHEADYFESEAQEAAMSRLWAGIHFRHDNEKGLDVGHKIGGMAVLLMKSDPRLPFELP